jgi:hypothetical protein
MNVNASPMVHLLSLFAMETPCSDTTQDSLFAPQRGIRGRVRKRY